MTLLSRKQLTCYLIFVKISFEQEHVEGYLELSAKTKTYFATAAALWDADFYVKVDDDVHVNIGKDATFSCLVLNSRKKSLFRSVNKPNIL